MDVARLLSYWYKKSIGYRYSILLKTPILSCIRAKLTTPHILHAQKSPQQSPSNVTSNSILLTFFCQSLFFREIYPVYCKYDHVVTYWNSSFLAALEFMKYFLPSSYVNYQNIPLVQNRERPYHFKATRLYEKSHLSYVLPRPYKNDGFYHLLPYLYFSEGVVLNIACFIVLKSKNAL